jgi:hypothetical protein
VSTTLNQPSRCTCTSFRQTHRLGPDLDAERVAAMVAQGIDQWTASLIVYSAEPGVLPPTVEETPRWVRLSLLLRLPWLRLEAGSIAEDFLLWIGCLLAAGLFITVLAVSAR